MELTNILNPKSKLKIKQRYRNHIRSIKKKYPSISDELLQFSIKEIDSCNIIGFLKSIKPKLGLEIGSFCGVSTSFFLNEFHDLEIHCVDPWEPFGINDPSIVFDEIVNPFSNRITKYKQYFGSKNPNIGKKIEDKIGIFYPKQQYDFVFIDGDHRTTSSISGFMICKEYTDVIIYHDAMFPQHKKSFEIINNDWGNRWKHYLLENGEDGVGIYMKNRNY